VLRCDNCGYAWTPAGETGVSHITLAYVCPVCQYPVSAESASAIESSLTPDELAERLSALINEARTAQVDPEAIVQILKDELEFAAEISHAGRNIYVQIIDLGPSEGEVITRPVRDRSTILRRRALG
jgi:hypothetical protein